MPLVLVRVDCRLIHGQIIEAWVPHTKADSLVVANDDAAADDFQRSIMRMSVPPTLDVDVLDLENAALQWRKGRWSRKKAILLFASCRDAFLSYQAGLNFEQLNLGNVKCTPEQGRLTCTMSLDQADAVFLRLIQDEGIKVDARLVPRDPARDLNQLLGGDRSGTA